jgi:hypothetical protein
MGKALQMGLRFLFASLPWSIILSTKLSDRARISLEKETLPAQGESERRWSEPIPHWISMQAVQSAQLGNVALISRPLETFFTRRPVNLM